MNSVTVTFDSGTMSLQRYGISRAEARSHIRRVHFWGIITEGMEPAYMKTTGFCINYQDKPSYRGIFKPDDIHIEADTDGIIYCEVEGDLL